MIRQKVGGAGGAGQSGGAVLLARLSIVGKGDTVLCNIVMWKPWNCVPLNQFIILQKPVYSTEQF